METDDDFPDDVMDEGYGFCPNCGAPLSNWGAASHGDGDIFDEIGCDQCQDVIREQHATYCQCVDCAPWAWLPDDPEERDRQDGQEREASSGTGISTEIPF